VFSTLIGKAEINISTALAYNLMGALFGGLMEYNSMYFGFAFLYLLAIGFYFLSWVFSWEFAPAWMRQRRAFWAGIPHFRHPEFSGLRDAPAERSGFLHFSPSPAKNSPESLKADRCSGTLLVKGMAMDHEQLVRKAGGGDVKAFVELTRRFQQFASALPSPWCAISSTRRRGAGILRGGLVGAAEPH